MRQAPLTSRLLFALIVLSALTVPDEGTAAGAASNPVSGDRWNDQSSSVAIADPAATAGGQVAQIQAHLQRAQVRRAAGDLELAAREFEAAVGQGCDDPRVFQSLGEVLMQIEPGERGVAFPDIADYTRGIRDDPDQVLHYFNRGLAWLQLDQFERAFADFSAALTRQPQNAASRRNRGYAYWLKGDRISALVGLAQAAHINDEGQSESQSQWPATPDYRIGDVAAPRPVGKRA